MKKLVAGMGVTGRAVAHFFIKHKIPFDCFDNIKTQQVLATDLKYDDFQTFNTVDGLDFSNYDEVVISPGWIPHHPLLVAAHKANCPVVAEIELAWRYAKGTIIGITGSNGKSTTTSLAHHLIAASGKRTSLCGNIGTPFIACVDDDPDHVYVLELSSFQLHGIREFRANIALLLNLSPDHIDWHGGFENYMKAKFNIFRNQHDDDLAILSKELASAVSRRIRSILLPNADAFVGENAVHLNQNDSIPFETIPLLGKHNRENVLFAALAAQAVGISLETILQALPSFKGLEHRMEMVGIHEGRRWINDTKATNVHACQAAVNAMEGSYVLILGGCDKGERFTDLNLKQHPPKAVIAYGETAPIIMEDVDFPGIIHVHAFEEACLHAHSIAGMNTAVLLAPACASFDQFDNFAQRGMVFKQIFRAMVEAP